MSPTEQYQKEIQNNFGWRVINGWGVQFTLSQLRYIWSSGWAIKRFVETIDSSSDGRDWIRKNIGNAEFRLGGEISVGGTFQRILSIPGNRSFVGGPSGNIVWLYPTFHILEKNPVRHVIHELAHVWDSNSSMSNETFFGGGRADRLAHYLGGEPSFPRFWNGTSGINPRFEWPLTLNYGNTSSGEYFAEAFSWSVVDRANLPHRMIFEWISLVVDLSN